MLAPRKTLWSTPLNAVDHCMEWIPLDRNDCVLDIGCGDGRILLTWAERVSASAICDTLATMRQEDLRTLTFLGIDIDSERIRECKLAAKEAKTHGRIHPDIRMEFVCANALDSVRAFQNATVIFLYLIPRGLKQIYPLLCQHAKENISHGKTIRVATYMSKLPPSENPVGRALCIVEHQQEAAWPIYFYELHCHEEQLDTTNDHRIQVCGTRLL